MDKHKIYDIERAVVVILNDLKYNVPDGPMGYARFDALAERLERIASATRKAANRIDAWAQVAKSGGVVNGRK